MSQEEVITLKIIEITFVSLLIGLAKSRLLIIMAVTAVLLWAGLHLLPLLSRDRYILSSLLSVFCTQGMKPFTYQMAGRIDWRQLFRCGGMPSSHSAVVAALATALGLDYGWTSPVFQTSAVLGSIVVYDSCTLRRTVGEQSRIIRELVQDKRRQLPLLKGKMGHTPIEASLGVLCGVLCALFVVRF
ncbi:MAG TPA: hypothetical protein DDY25_04500 [Peptococcaceae bacterium]|nr:divergent PAP2 family protein [Syntrophaceticus sp.]HBG22878.1 hypothetical protein [Peptococcaceae bacterium]HBI26970.1 hypothetical protein [Peptococcaceae bacterium]